MKKVNKKGFTLLEVIVTIGIICVLGLIVVPAIINYRNKSKTEYNNKLQENIIQIAKDYYVSNRDELPNGQVEGKYATSLKLETLRQENYITNDVIDADKNSCTSESFVVVENNRGNYNYYVCLKCGNKTYSTSPSYCEFQNGEGSLPTCELTYNDSWSKENVVINITSTDSIGIINIKQNGKVLKTTYDENNKTYNATYEVSESGKYSFDILNKYGLKTTCVTENEIKIDKDVPTCSITKEDKTISSVTLKVTASDTTSGIKNILINNTELENNLYNATKNGTYKAIVTDLANNTTSCSIDVTELDNEVPTLTASVSNKDGKAVITVIMKDNIGVVGYQEGIQTSTTDTWVSIESTTEKTITLEKNKVGTYYVYAKDEAGNIGTISYELKATDIDPTPPVLTFGIDGTQGEIAVITCSDPESGIIGEERQTETLTGRNNVTVTRTCKNNAGLETTASHTYKYTSCKTGSNTCRYGCDSVYDSCATGSPNACVGGYDEITTTTYVNETTCNTCTYNTTCRNREWVSCPCNSPGQVSTGGSGHSNCWCEGRNCIIYNTTTAANCSKCGSTTKTVPKTTTKKSWNNCKTTKNTCQGDYVTDQCTCSSC